MIERVYEPQELERLLALNAPPEQITEEFDAAEWLASEKIIALRIDDDLAIFEECWPCAAFGHIWFHSRGRMALTRAKQMLDHAASLGITEILGEVPIWRRDVERFIRKLGFLAIGVGERPEGMVIVFRRIANSFPARLVA